MAIAFARARYLSRSTSGCAVRSASYNAREAITDARTGERYSFVHRGAPEHHAVLLPDGADDRLADAAALWNLAEGAERRRDAQLAREIVLALPADAALTHDDRVALAESFAREHSCPEDSRCSLTCTPRMPAPGRRAWSPALTAHPKGSGRTTTRTC